MFVCLLVKLSPPYVMSPEKHRVLHSKNPNHHPFRNFIGDTEIHSYNERHLVGYEKWNYWCSLGVLYGHYLSNTPVGNKRTTGWGHFSVHPEVSLMIGKDFSRGGTGIFNGGVSTFFNKKSTGPECPHTVRPPVSAKTKGACPCFCKKKRGCTPGCPLYIRPCSQYTVAVKVLPVLHTSLLPSQPQLVPIYVPGSRGAS